MLNWAIAAACAVLVGLSKTGIPGLGILAVVLLAPIFPAGGSLGVVLPMLMIADAFAVAHFRSKANWKALVRLIPPTLIGIVLGFVTLHYIGGTYINRLIAVMILALLVLQFFREMGFLSGEHVPHRWWFAWSLGLLAGFATMVANAAGPVTIIYLLAMKLEKVEFMGTAAWFYLIFNWVKVPFQLSLDFIKPGTLLVDLILVPGVIVGIVLGVWSLHRIPQKVFQHLALALAALATVRLLILG